MFGCSMPTPLAMPVTLTRRPSISAAREAAFGTVSVVMIAAAAPAQFAPPSVARHRGSAASIRSTGSGSRITPVENGSTSSGGAAEDARHGLAGALRGAQPRFARPAIRVAGIGDERADRSPRREVAPADLHRRGGEAVLREYARDPASRREPDEHQVAAAALPDAGLREAELDAVDDGELRWDRAGSD